MPPKKPGLSEFELFRMLLTNMINMSHPLVKVANEIDWTRFDAAWGKFYHEKKGRPGLPTRLMAGLHLLKHMHGPTRRCAPGGRRTRTGSTFAARSTFACRWCLIVPR